MAVIHPIVRVYTPIIVVARHTKKGTFWAVRFAFLQKKHNFVPLNF